MSQRICLKRHSRLKRKSCNQKVKHLTSLAKGKKSLVDEKEKDIEELIEQLFRQKKERDDLKIQVVELYLHIEESETAVVHKKAAPALY